MQLCTIYTRYPRFPSAKNNLTENLPYSPVVVLGTIVGVSVLLWLVTLIVRHRLSPVANNARRRAATVLPDLIRHTHWWLPGFVALYAITVLFELPDRVDSVARYLVVIALAIQAGIWATTLLGSAIDRYQQKQMKEDPGRITALNAVGFIGKLVLWSAVAMVALDNLGFNITTLVAGLGVGGIAVALAVQNILGDLFASLSIVIDRPFGVGDFLVIDDYMGTVEQVGLKTTRIRSLSGEQLVFSNSDLLKSRIRNYGMMYQRRVVQQIGVTCQTPRDKLK